MTIRSNTDKNNGDGTRTQTSKVIHNDGSWKEVSKVVDPGVIYDTTISKTITEGGPPKKQ